MAALLTAGVLMFILRIGPADALINLPPTAWSYYVNQPDTTAGQNALVSIGCNQAAGNKSSKTNSMVVLDFGGLYNDSGYQQETNNTILAPSQVEQLAEDFIAGYAYCGSGGYTSWLLVGTNNSIALDYAKGQQFANTVDTVHNWNTFSTVIVEGANDIEDWGGSATTTQAYNWYNGYSSVSSLNYADYGSANGCPTNTSDTCEYGWTQGDYYNLSWGLTLAYPLPEIYYNVPPGSPVNAEQWANISVYGQGVHGNLEPCGPMDEHDLAPNSLTASQAWPDLGFFFPNIQFSVEIHRTP
jgi:hypothetical protein